MFITGLMLVLSQMSHFCVLLCVLDTVGLVAVILPCSQWCLLQEG